MKKKRIPAFLICLILLFTLSVPVLAYPDVAAGEWYTHYVDVCTEKGIFEGFEDGTFRPTGYLRRGEFIKMLAVSAGVSNSKAPSGVHWAEPYWIALSENRMLGGIEIFNTYDSLQEYITRGEMAQLIYNYLMLRTNEKEENVGGARRVIPDFAEIPAASRNAVAQIYAKGIINGMINTPGVEDGSFCGDRKLTRAQASAVMVRLLDAGERTPVKMENHYVLADAPNKDKAFAIWASEMGMFSGTGAQERLNEILFGSASKGYFTDEADAADWMRSVEVNVWTLNGEGKKVASTMNLTVHKYLAADVYDIFQLIFEDKEQFPIRSLGGARYSDAMRHAWGAAIDINVDENCAAKKTAGQVTVTSGNGWWPEGAEKSEWAGTLTEPSAYSFSADCSVVKAFKQYGWGWGGSWSGDSRDFMHFSIRPDGG